MPKYCVRLTKHEYYEVEANSFDDAEQAALDMYYNDKYAFLEDPVDEIEVEEVKI